MSNKTASPASANGAENNAINHIPLGTFCHPFGGLDTFCFTSTAPEHAQHHQNKQAEGAHGAANKQV